MSRGTSGKFAWDAANIALALGSAGDYASGLRIETSVCKATINDGDDLDHDARFLPVKSGKG